MPTSDPDTHGPTPVDALARHLREDATLGSVAGVVSWDEQTQMPPAGTTLRADQLALLARLIHARATDPRLGDLVADAEHWVASQDLPEDSPEAATARDARRDFGRATKLPADLVEHMAREQVVGHGAWVEARKGDNFAAFLPHLRTTIGLKREEAQAVGFEHEPYDALLDDYEPGETAADLRKVFDALRGPLVDLVARASEARDPDRQSVLRRQFPVDGQREFSVRVATAFGFDFDAGRLDVAVHPFCTGLGPGDTRMTTRFDENDLGNSFYSTLHETGHALYEQNLPKTQYFGTGPGKSISLGIHESQSRMWENQVGRSEAFWRYWLPAAREIFPASLADVPPERVAADANDIRPSFIRTEADEATYNLHVLLRFELEVDLLNGTLDAGDVPDAWDGKVRDYLGITPVRPSEGCLQDVHWSAGLVGYFPTYTLGNLYAAQLFEEAGRELGDLEVMFGRGQFLPLLEWLKRNVHSVGRRRTARQLVERVTGRPLSAEPLLNHLRNKVDRLAHV